MLLLSGVDLMAKDTHGRTITDLAQLMRATDTLEVIKEFSRVHQKHYSSSSSESPGATPQRERVKVRVRRSPKVAAAAAAAGGVPNADTKDANQGGDDLAKLLDSIKLDDNEGM
jgi:hypothetical protein